MFPIGDFPDSAAEIAAEQLVRYYDYGIVADLQ